LIHNFYFDFVLFKKMAKYSIVLIPNSFMWWIMNSLDKIMITSMIGPSANGIYSISYKLPTLLTIFSSIFNQAWSYSAIKEKDSIDVDSYNNRIFNGLFEFLVIICVFLLLILRPFLKYYVAVEYYDSWKYSTILIGGFVFMTLGSFVATSYTVYKDSSGFVKSAFIGALINAILNFILIIRIGIFGAAISTLISYVVIFVYRLIDTKKYNKYHINNKNFFVGIILILLSIIFNYMKGTLSYILLFINLLICMIIYKRFILEMINDFVIRRRNKNEN